ncbi:hypothetical protein [Methylobacter sp.]|uniref:hypothetical protein n=1 Tax=Methylobacter sp. TaxID=2051955 RepID=UPI00121965C2|nr:hypothetical protein [Methylobacter sp.]TAK64431.1 MAG: hypothetical protein EPO18_03345 [Methylobacter sp.]
MKAVTNKKTEEGTVENAKEAVKKPNIALVGVKKGAIAAKEAATKIATAPSKAVDSALYGVCYGMSYGVVFTSLAIVKMLPVNSPVMKGFHDGAKVARKDSKAYQEKHHAHEKSTAMH